ncbi:MAG: hypothetical protein KKH72_05030 [Alphaproteobacteria bacterium]|nr:hypothetical protein [Alphaproteobacteria bacterium]
MTILESERPAILRDLPHETSKMVLAFADRLDAQFPAGTDERALKSRLTEWGFQLDEDDVGQYARLRIEAATGQDTYFVYWMLDAKRRLTHIEADVHISRP